MLRSVEVAMREVVALGYVVVSAADLDAWTEFGQAGLGLQLSDGPPGGRERNTRFFRMDERRWRLAVEEGPDGGLVALGFEVPSPAALTQLCRRLEAAGHVVKDAPALAAERGVIALTQVTDPSGVPLEFFYGATIDNAAFVSPTGARFVTGGQGLGHAVISAADTDETSAFYIDLLGFRLSDTISFMGMELYFTSPNRRHHSLAFSSRPGAPGGQLEHIMLEVDDLDVVGRAQDYCLDRGAIRVTLGKHVNDHMVSFYCLSPSGPTIEYGWGGREIDDSTHQIGHYEAAHYWGHRPPDGTNLEEAMRKAMEQAQGDDA
jgi:3,4-dihydroxy-9,10-secoandrosta-1,3,5(10)-triene-9,17-dione 4,5-dioxygenase